MQGISLKQVSKNDSAMLKNMNTFYSFNYNIYML